MRLWMVLMLSLPALMVADVSSGVILFSRELLGRYDAIAVHAAVGSTSPCVKLQGSKPTLVDPLFVRTRSPACIKSVSPHGFLVQVSGHEKTQWQLEVQVNKKELVLMAMPVLATSESQSIMVARTFGRGKLFMKFELESGWAIIPPEHGSNKFTLMLQNQS